MSGWCGPKITRKYCLENKTWTFSVWEEFSVNLRCSLGFSPAWVIELGIVTEFPFKTFGY